MKALTSHLIGFKGDSVCIWNRSWGVVGQMNVEWKYATDGKYLQEKMRQKKNRIFEELKESHTWNIENKEETVRYKTGKKGRHGVSRQCIKIALHIKKRRQPLKCTKQGCGLIIFEF